MRSWKLILLILVIVIGYGGLVRGRQAATFRMIAHIGDSSPAASELKAFWIWANETKDDQTIVFKREFNVDKLPEKAAIYLTVDDSFELSVNHQKIAHSVPKLGDFPGWIKVHFADIRKFLKLGKNVIDVHAYNVKGEAGLLARMDLDDHPALVSDQSWYYFTGTRWEHALEIGAINQAPGDRDEILDGWPGFSPVFPAHLQQYPMQATSVVTIHPGSGVIDGAESITETSEHTHVTLNLSNADRKDPPFVVLDFGKEISGRLVLRSKQTALTLVTTGESLEETLHSPWKTFRVITTPGLESGTGSTGFRYAKIAFMKLKGQSNAVEFSQIAANRVEYPVTYRGSFDCSDPRLTQIWNTGAYTAHLCMQDEIWDAPKRDRVAWMGDLHVSGEVINTVFADRFLMEKTLRKLREDAQGGNPPDAPPLRHVNSIPGYSCAWIAALADFHRHVGDMDFLREQKPSLISLLKYLRGELDSRGVFANIRQQSNFVDWSPGSSIEGQDSLRATHFFLTLAAQEASFLFHELGDEAEADQTLKWANDLREAARKYLLDPQMGTYGGRRQVNAMAILAGVPTPEQKSAIYEKVLEPGSPSWKQVATPYYNFYVLKAMTELGHTPAGMDFVRDYWGGMLDLGATTFWEAYDPSWPKENFHSHLQVDFDTGTMASLSHGWSSGPTAWLTETVLGVRPLAGGYREVEIRPELGDLHWAEGEVPTPQGNLRIRIDRDKNSPSIRMHLTVPNGVHAQVLLPRSRNVRVSGPGEFDLVSDDEGD